MKRSLSSGFFKSADIKQPVTVENTAPANASSSDDGYTSGETSSSKRRKEGSDSTDFSSDRSSPYASTGPNSPNIFDTSRDSYTNIRSSIDQWKVLIDDAIKSSQVSQAAVEERGGATDKFFSVVKQDIAVEIKQMDTKALDISQSKLIDDVKSVFASELPSAKEQLKAINTILSYYCAHSLCAGRLMKNNGSNNLNLTDCHSENSAQSVNDIDNLCECIDDSLTF